VSGAGNVTSVENCKQSVWRLGSGGISPNPNYSHTYSLTPENPFIATIAQPADPFAGGDWELNTFKDWANAVMTEIKNLKGTPYWYSNGGAGTNVADLWFDAVGSVITSKGAWAHSAITPGELVWSAPVFIRSILGEYSFTLTGPSSVTLADTEVAYISLNRDNNFQAGNVFTFTSGSPTVTATLPVTGLVANDWIKLASDPISAYTQVLTVVGTTVTLNQNYLGSSGTGEALNSTSTYTIQSAMPESVPDSTNTYWIAKRDDNVGGGFSFSISSATRTDGSTVFTYTGSPALVQGQVVIVSGFTDTTFNGTFQIMSIPSSGTFQVNNTGADGTATAGTPVVKNQAKLYVRGVGELDQGAVTQVDGSFPAEVLEYIGSPSEIATDPDYDNLPTSSLLPFQIIGADSLTQGLSNEIGNMNAMQHYMSLLFQNNSAMLTNGGLITFSGTSVSFTDPLDLFFPGLVSGGTPVSVSLGSTTISGLVNGDLIYVVVSRGTDGSTSPTLVSGPTVATTLPTVVPANYDVWLLAAYITSGDGTERLYFRDGTVLNVGETSRLGEGGGGGNSFPYNDDLISLLFAGKITDTFTEAAASASSTIDSTITNATYESATDIYQIAYDASKTIAAGTTTTNIVLSSAIAGFTPAINDVVIWGGNARLITAIVTPGLVFTVNAFASAPTLASQVTVSQKVGTKDLYSTAFNGNSLYTSFHATQPTFQEFMVDYEDSTTAGDNVFDIALAPVVGWDAHGDDGIITPVGERPDFQTQVAQSSFLDAATTNHFYLRFFCINISGSGTVNLLGYRAYVQKEGASSGYGVQNSSVGWTDNSGTPVNCTIATPAGFTQITFPWQYPMNVSPGLPEGALRVMANGQELPRYCDASSTPPAYYTEISSTVIQLDGDYSASDVQMIVFLPVTVIDTNTQNTTNIATIHSTAGAAYVGASNSGHTFLTGATVQAQLDEADASLVTINNKVPTVSRVTTGTHAGGFPTNASGTYTTPTGAKKLYIRIIGGGSGGCGGGSTAGSTSAGGNTLFGTTLLQANGAGGATGGANGTGGAGGSGGGASSPAILVNHVAGGSGGGGSSSQYAENPGSSGGSSFYGGGGGGGSYATSPGFGAAPDSGAGGGGGAGGTGGISGAAGGAGEYVEAIILNPSPTYPYSVGAGSAQTSGSGGGSGYTNGGGGSNGSIIIIEEY
jgi:hypothetical protein